MKYKFHIGAYTPETIPMARLSEYLRDLAKLLGNQEHVHFESVESGSTMPVMNIDREVVGSVRARLAAVKTDNADPEAQAAYRALNKKLEQDRTHGELFLSKSEKLKAVVLDFPGIKQKSKKVISIKQVSSVDGVIVSLGGKDATAHIKLQDGHTIYTGIEISRAKAIELKDYLWSGYVRLTGDAIWERKENGWELHKMKVSKFEVLSGDSLGDAIDVLRNLSGNEWKGISDPAEELRKIREQ